MKLDCYIFSVVVDRESGVGGCDEEDENDRTESRILSQTRRVGCRQGVDSIMEKGTSHVTSSSSTMMTHMPITGMASSDSSE